MTQTLHALIWTTDRRAKNSCTSKQWLQQSSQTLSSTYAEQWRSSGTCASSYAHCCPVATQTTSRLLLAGGCNWKYNVPELLHCSAYMYVDSSIREGCCSHCLLVCRNPLFRMHVSLQQLLVSPLYVYVSITDWCCARKVNTAMACVCCLKARTPKPHNLFSISLSYTLNEHYGLLLKSELLFDPSPHDFTYLLILLSENFTCFPSPEEVGQHHVIPS